MHWFSLHAEKCIGSLFCARSASVLSVPKMHWFFHARNALVLSFGQKCISSLFHAKCDHSHSGCRLLLQRVASQLAMHQWGWRACSDFLQWFLKLTDTAVSPHTCKWITPTWREILPASSDIVLQICNTFLDWFSKNKPTTRFSKNKPTNPRFGLAACWNEWNSLLWWQNST